MPAPGKVPNAQGKEVECIFLLEGHGEDGAPLGQLIFAFTDGTSAEFISRGALIEIGGSFAGVEPMDLMAQLKRGCKVVDVAPYFDDDQ